MSQAREERLTIKTVTKNNEEDAYAVVDENKRKSKCDQGGPSSSEVREVQPSSEDEHLAADQSAVKESTEMCDKSNDQEEKGRHVYANVLVKENKEMFFKTAVSRDDGLDVAYTKGSSAMGKDPVEHLNRSSLEQGKEINSKKATSEQDPYSATDCNDHFYAAVDKSKKKRMAPKKPLPYCSGHLMYADMSHLPTNKNGKVHRACASTVYADINHSAKRKVKTGFKPRLPTM
ncbi:uncharacterized protein [Porites lutea]|uniref:uncharacterized protein n=1 Tax=Porites lutea TaxID=51062 RepID=UPI003CC6BEDB